MLYLLASLDRAHSTESLSSPLGDQLEGGDENFCIKQIIVRKVRKLGVRCSRHAIMLSRIGCAWNLVHSPDSRKLGPLMVSFRYRVDLFCLPTKKRHLLLLDTLRED